jgi:hypothetical protein
MTSLALMIKRLVFVVGLLLVAQSTNASTIKAAVECDSIFLSNGKVYAVKKLSWTKAEVSFAFCDDAESNLITAPWQQIRRIKRADGSVLYSSEGSVLTAEELRLEREVNGLRSMAIIAIPTILLFGLGLVLAFVVLIRGAKLKKAIVGHPKEQQLKKILKRAGWIAKAILLGWLTVGLIGFGYIIYIFSLFGKNQ